MVVKNIDNNRKLYYDGHRGEQKAPAAFGKMGDSDYICCSGGCTGNHLRHISFYIEGDYSGTDCGGNG